MGYEKGVFIPHLTSPILGEEEDENTSPGPSYLRRGKGCGNSIMGEEEERRSSG